MDRLVDLHLEELATSHFLIIQTSMASESALGHGLAHTVPQMKSVPLGTVSHQTVSYCPRCWVGQEPLIFSLCLWWETCLLGVWGQGKLGPQCSS